LADHNTHIRITTEADTSGLDAATRAQEELNESADKFNEKAADRDGASGRGVESLTDRFSRLALKVTAVTAAVKVAWDLFKKTDEGKAAIQTLTDAFGDAHKTIDETTRTQLTHAAAARTGERAAREQAEAVRELKDAEAGRNAELSHATQLTADNISYQRERLELAKQEALLKVRAEGGGTREEAEALAAAEMEQLKQRQAERASEQGLLNKGVRQARDTASDAQKAAEAAAAQVRAAEALEQISARLAALTGTGEEPGELQTARTAASGFDEDVDPKRAAIPGTAEYKYVQRRDQAAQTLAEKQKEFDDLTARQAELRGVFPGAAPKSVEEAEKDKSFADKNAEAARLEAARREREAEMQRLRLRNQAEQDAANTERRRNLIINSARVDERLEKEEEEKDKPEGLSVKTPMRGGADYMRREAAQRTRGIASQIPEGRKLRESLEKLADELSTSAAKEINSALGEIRATLEDLDLDVSGRFADRSEVAELRGLVQRLSEQMKGNRPVQ
jgi:hypothetical protein